jgi:hypothetical protein
MKLTSGFRLRQKPDRRRALELLAASRAGQAADRRRTP